MTLSDVSITEIFCQVDTFCIHFHMALARQIIGNPPKKKYCIEYQIKDEQNSYILFPYRSTGSLLVLSRVASISFVDFGAISCLCLKIGNQVPISCIERDIQKRCREIIIQVCDVEEVGILRGVVSKDHVHIHIEYPPRTSIAELVKRDEGSQFSVVAKEISPITKPLLGSVFLANRLWSLEYWI